MRIRKSLIPEEKVELQMAPMIDCVFQLLVYFMVATHFLQTETELNVNLPVSAEVMTQSQPTADEVIIEITDNGNVVVNSQEYDSPQDKDLPQLVSMLSRLSSVYNDQPVIIQPAEGVSHGRVVDVLNACAASNIKNISFYSS
jgi:biopolymer transport protein ExbD